VIHREGKFARLDIAIDTDAIHIDRIVQAVDGDELVSRCQWAKEERMLRGAAGRTVYVGAPSSDRRVRFYDKAAEQKLNENLPEGVEPFVWTRAEIQHRNRHAQIAAQAIVDGELDPLALFNSVLDFRDPASDINPSRRVRCDWWAAWLGSLTERVSFAFARPDKAIRQVAEWFERQVSTVTAMLAVADPDNFRLWLLSAVDKGFDRLDPFRRQKAKRFRELGLTLM
jgi:DNA relaxase NicK